MRVNSIKESANSLSVRHNIEKPVLSPNFTIEDIHKLREYNYEMTKDYTTDELIEYYKNKADEVAKKYAL